MSILIFAVLLILILALAIYLIDMVPMDSRLRLAAKAIILIIAIILLCERAGLL